MFLSNRAVTCFYNVTALFGYKENDSPWFPPLKIGTAIMDLPLFINCTIHCWKGEIFMSEQTTPASLCKSVFKNGEKASISERLTEKWAELIKLLEETRPEFLRGGQ